MNLLMYSLGISMLCVAFLSVTNLPTWINFKPFNCAVCLSFWVVAISIYIGANELLEPLAYAGYAAYFGMIAKRLMMRI